MLAEGSAIAPEIAAARGYQTITRRADAPAAFKGYQRRVPALVVPIHSPNGVTRSHQLRPDKPRKAKNGTAVKYETPSGARTILDCNPAMMGEIREGGGELWVTEGARKVDALASRGVPAVGFAGVWMFAEPKTHGTVPLPCWRHVQLRGRTVVVAYDADAKTNANVQQAVGRLVAMLEKLGAHVLVVYVPAVNGDDKAGVDDYLATGGTVEELRRTARPYEPVDVGAERMFRSPDLRAAVEAVREHIETITPRRQRGCTARSIMRDLLAAASREGRVVDSGIFVRRAERQMAEGAKVGSTSTVKENVDWLEAEGYLQRVPEPGKARDRAAAYLLLVPEGIARKANIRVGGKGKGNEGQQEASSSRSVTASNPGVRLPRYPSDRAVPELRWSKLVLYWAMRDGRRVVVDHEYVARIRKDGREIIAYVYDAGGDVDEAELREAFASPITRPWDFRRRKLARLVAYGILEISEGRVTLTESWREALDAARERDGEIEDDERQRERHRKQREQFAEAMRRGIPKMAADPVPELRGKERVRLTMEANRERWRREEVEEERRKVGVSAASFLADELEGVVGVRWGEVRGRWQARGGRAEHLRAAVARGPFRFEREASDGALYVYPDGKVPPRPKRARSAPVAPLRAGPDESAEQRRTGPRSINGIQVHGGDCGCWLCGDDLGEVV